MSSNARPAHTADREIVTTRVVNAPRELVFKVWTEAEHVAKWWGPKDFTNTIHSMDVRPGGIWRLTMHGPDGTDYPNEIFFIDVVKPERLVYSHGEPGAEDSFHVTIDFLEQEGKTRINMQMVFRTAAQRNLVVEKFGAIEGNIQMIDRLEAHLAYLRN